jgi:hypothetical protein
MTPERMCKVTSCRDSGIGYNEANLGVRQRRSQTSYTSARVQKNEVMRVSIATQGPKTASGPRAWIAKPKSSHCELEDGVGDPGNGNR